MNLSFINPWGLLGLIGVPILILFYILKRRYQEEVVSSTFLWERAKKYMKRRFSWNMRNTILLLFQIIAIVCLSMLLARPTVIPKTTDEVIIILDGSASMMTEDGSGATRFDRAKKEMEKYAEKAGTNSRVTVISASAQAERYAFRSDQPNDILNAIDKCECSYGNADIEGALLLAYGAQEENTEATILFFTDSNYGHLEGIQVVNVAEKEDSWNAAAVGLRGELKENSWVFTGTVASYGSDADLTVALYVDGQYVSTKKVECSANEPTEVVFREYESRRYIVAEMLILDAGDYLSEDDTYSCSYIQDDNTLIQLVVGPNSLDSYLYVESALRSQGGTVVATIIAYSIDKEGHEIPPPDGSDIRYSGYDLYVFMGVIPDIMPDDGSVWFINPPTGKVTQGEEDVEVICSLPSVVDVTFGERYVAQAGSPYSITSSMTTVQPYAQILQGISFGNIAVGQYIEMESTSYVPLLQVGNHPVIMAGMNGFQRIVVMTIETSDMGLEGVGQVLLYRNLLNFACHDVVDGQEFHVGEQVEMTMPAGATKVTIEHDGVAVMVMDAQNTIYSFSRPGNYRIIIELDRAGDGVNGTLSSLTYRCYVSIPDGESNIYMECDSLSSIPIPDDVVTEFEPEEIWQILLIVLLLIMLAEWWVYYRV